MSIFHLQQFTIDQSQSGMKICSDSLLFGALIPVKGAKRILDIGTGTGILSLMQAQKIDELNSFDLKQSTLEVITAVELTHAAAEEAQKNFDNSPWSKQIELIEQDIQGFAKNHYMDKNDDEKESGYDLIICNPPFFAKQSKTHSNNPLRHTARHTDSLSFEELMVSINLLLSKSGKVFVLLPVIASDDVVSQAKANGLYFFRQIDIAESAEHSSKVAVFEFGRDVKEKTMPSFQKERLNKFQQANVHSDAVQKLLQPFLLRYR